MIGPSNHPAAAYPSWLPALKLPLTVVAGPPGNGARAWIDDRASPEDLILDIAGIIEDLSGLPAHRAGPEWIVPALQRRNDTLSDFGSNYAAVWLIAPCPFAWQRKFWIDRGAKLELLDPGRTAALIGARDAGVSEKWVHRWYSEAEGLQAAPAPPPAAERATAAKRGYGPEHRVLRDRQLAREPWCRFCWEERGVKVRATILDHIEPFKPGGIFDGRLWGNPGNHRSLCQDCHDARGAKTNRPERPPGAALDGRPLDPLHPWHKSYSAAVR